MVFEYSAAGATERWISREMGIKLQTVKNHKYEVFKKLDITNILEAVIRLREVPDD
jgi:DNA-binding CsgD family transcriptional regulator